MSTLVLKVDVDTYRGTLIGVPRLVELLLRHRADATFLFSLGPDHTGRAIKRVFRRGFMKKVSRTSVLSHYGFKTLMYGTLLPGPDIGRCCAGTAPTPPFSFRSAQTTPAGRSSAPSGAASCRKCHEPRWSRTTASRR